MKEREVVAKHAGFFVVKDEPDCLPVFEVEGLVEVEADEYVAILLTKMAAALEEAAASTSARIEDLELRLRALARR